MEKKITVKSTKSELIEAYNELLKKAENKDEDPKVKQKQQTESKIINSVSGISTEAIFKQFTDLKINLTSGLSQLEDKTTIAFKEYENLQNAISIEKKNLEELYEINVNTHSLSALLLAQKEKSEAFEIEMKEKKQQYENEEEQRQISLKETKLLLEKDRKREDEEYQYNLKLARKKDADNYQEQKQLLEKQLAEKQINFEKEIAEREAKLIETETELVELIKKADEFPEILEKEIGKTSLETEEKIKQQFNFEKQLSENTTKGLQQLKDQTIETLQAKIKDQDSLIQQLSKKVNVSEDSVKQIALKALDSSGKERVISIGKSTEKGESI